VLDGAVFCFFLDSGTSSHSYNLPIPFGFGTRFKVAFAFSIFFNWFKILFRRKKG